MLPPAANDSRRRIIVGIDPTDAGLRALRFAVDLSRASHAELHAVRAWTFPLSWHNAAADRARSRIARHSAEQCLSTAFDDAEGGSAADISVDRVLREGRAGRVLLDYATRATDLIVIGGQSGSWWTQGRGATTRYCVANAHVPVIVIPRPGRQRASALERLIRALNQPGPRR